MKKTKEECLLMNGIMSIDLGNNEVRIMKAMDEYALQVKIPTDAQIKEKAFDCYDASYNTDTETTSLNIGFQVGAKWMRETLTKE